MPWINETELNELTERAKEWEGHAKVLQKELEQIKAALDEKDLPTVQTTFYGDGCKYKTEEIVTWSEAARFWREKAERLESKAKKDQIYADIMRSCLNKYGKY